MEATNVTERQWVKDTIIGIFVRQNMYLLYMHLFKRVAPRRNCNFFSILLVDLRHSHFHSPSLPEPFLASHIRTHIIIAQHRPFSFCFLYNRPFACLVRRRSVPTGSWPPSSSTQTSLQRPCTPTQKIIEGSTNHCASNR